MKILTTDPTHTVGVFASLFDGEGRIVLVRQSYAGRCWTQPGGRLEVGESPITGVLREILEETGIEARIDGYVGTYVLTYRSDVVLHFRGSVVNADKWRSSEEIIECQAFEAETLPEPMRRHTRARIGDALLGKTNVFRTLLPQDEIIDL